MPWEKPTFTREIARHDDAQALIRHNSNITINNNKKHKWTFAEHYKIAIQAKCVSNVIPVYLLSLSLFSFKESCGDNPVKEDEIMLNIETENSTDTKYFGNLT